jgi:hypothetical protein
MSREEFDRVINSAEDNAESDFEVEFVASIRDKYNRYGFQMYFSRRQEEILDRIAYK